MQTDKAFNKESGNTTIIVLVVLAVIAVGALIYMGANGEKRAVGSQSTQSANVESVDNPVIAKVDGEKITRMDVFAFIQTLPANMRQTPVNELFPAALEQLVNSKIIESKTKNVNLDSDPKVKEQLAEAKANIVRQVYVENEVNSRLTDERVKSAYDQYTANFPDVEEVKARHILVKELKFAKDLLKKVKSGSDFAKLATEHSIDGTQNTGGELGYFVKSDVVPAFADAVFAMKSGEYITNPLKTEFGYHIIQVQDKRKRQPASYEEAKPYVESQLRQLILAEVLGDWRKDTDIERFDADGTIVAPSEPTTTPAPAAE